MLRANSPALPTLENDHLQVALHQNPSHNVWRLILSTGGPAQWNPVARLSVGGNLEGAEQTAAYRRRLGTYYPLQKAMPQNVRLREVNGVREMTFRLAVEDLWLDLCLILPTSQPYLWVTAPAVSHPFLLPETSIQFNATPRFVVADDPAAALRRASWHARDFRERGLWTRSAQYL